MAPQQVLFGAIWPLSFAALLRAKVPDGQMVRKISIEGHMFTPKEALAGGIVDHLVEGDTEAVVRKAVEVGKFAGANARLGVWGLIKVTLKSGYVQVANLFITERRLPRRVGDISKAIASNESAN